MTALKEKWSAFWAIIFDPWNVVLTIAVGGLFYLSLQKAEPLTSVLLFILLTLASAILGGRITQHWSAITEAGVVIARGRAAVRSLKLLLRNIAALETRIRSFRSKEDEIKNHPEVVKRNYEESIAICSLLQEETVSSIENWTDIVPEADIKTQIGVISDLKTSIDDKESELTQLKATLTEAQGKSEQDRKSLRDQIGAKEKQIRGLEREILDAKLSIGGLGLGTLGISSASALFSPTETSKSFISTSELFDSDRPFVIDTTSGVIKPSSKK
jgi:hypothetical protein